MSSLHNFFEKFLLLKYIILTYFESLCQQNSNQSIVLASRKRLSLRKAAPCICAVLLEHIEGMSHFYGCQY